MRSQRFIEAIVVGKSILFREGLAGILRAANFQVLASVSSADDLRPAKKTRRPRLYLIVQIGDDFDIALQQIALLRGRHPEARVALVTNHCRLNELTLAFRAGAHGYFISDITSETFVRSVSLVMMGEIIVPAALIKLKLDAKGSRLVEVANDPNSGKHISFASEDATAPILSSREREILRCIIDGASNKSIARKIDMNVATVKSHVKALLRKIRAENRTQAAIWGMNNGSRIQPEIERCAIKQIAVPATAALASMKNSKQ
jgi:Response regulator containing a CheY-like receiver domain and an HTH DNA-binding domain